MKHVIHIIYELVIAHFTKVVKYIYWSAMKSVRGGRLLSIVNIFNEKSWWLSSQIADEADES